MGCRILGAVNCTYTGTRYKTKHNALPVFPVTDHVMHSPSPVVVIERNSHVDHDNHKQPATFTCVVHQALQSVKQIESLEDLLYRTTRMSLIEIWITLTSCMVTTGTVMKR